MNFQSTRLRRVIISTVLASLLLLQINPMVFISYVKAEPLPVSFPVAAPVVDIVESTSQLVGGNACGIGSAIANDGLEVSVQNWYDEYTLEGRYFINGGSFSSWFNLATLGTLNVSGINANIFLDNSGDSPAGLAGWEVRVVDATMTPIGNLDTLNYNIVTSLNSFACQGVPQNLRWEIPTPETLACGSTTESYDVTAQWDAFDGATQYEYHVTTPGLPEWTTTVGTNSYVGAFTEGEGTYTFKVRATAPYVSGWSAECSITYSNPTTPDPVTYIVRPSEMQGWSVVAESGAQVNFISQPDSPLPVGALELITDETTASRSRTTLSVEIPLSEITNLSFDAKKVSGPEFAGAAFRLGIDNEGNGSIDQYIVYEPYYNETVLDNVWQTWDVDGGLFWGSWNPAGGYDSNQPLSSIPGVTPSAVVRAVSVGLGNWNPSWNIVVDKVQINHITYDFEQDPVIPNEAPSVTIVTPVENSYVRGSITGRALATDDSGMGSYYLRFWKDAFESGPANLVGNCQEAPGADLLGDSLDVTCAYDTTTNPDGMYVFSAQFLDEDIAWGMDTNTFFVDNTKPGISFVDPSSDGMIVGGTYNVEVHATDNMMLKRVAVNVYNDTNTVFLMPCGSTPADSSIGGTSFTFNCDIDTTTLADGTYTLRTAATDEAGNTKATSRTIVVDNTAPTVGPIEVVADYDPYVNGIAFLIRANVSDAVAGINPFTCAVTTNFNVSNPESSDWTPGLYLFGRCVSGSLFETDGDELEINVRVEDNVGNIGYGEFIERIADSRDPDFNTFNVTPVSGNYTNGSPTLTSTVSDTVSPITECQARYKRLLWSGWINGVLTPVGLDATCVVNLSGLTHNSVYDFQMRVKDSAGHWEESNVIYNLRVDSQIPSADPSGFTSDPAINTPSNDNTVWVSWLNGGVDNKSGVDGYSYDFTPAPSTPDQVKDLEETDNEATSTPLADGVWWFNLSTVDNVGNWTSTAHYGPFIIDTTAPTVAEENQLQDATFYEGDSIPTLWDLTANDNFDIAEVCFYLTWSPIGETDLGCYADSLVENTEYTWDIAQLLADAGITHWDTSFLHEGAYEVSYYVVDEAGNESEIYSVNYYIENVIPSVDIESDQTITEGEEAIFTGWFSDPSCIEGESETEYEEGFTLLSISESEVYCDNRETPDDSDWVIVVDYGDGSSTTFSQSTPGNITIPSHTYTHEGEYEVTLMVCESESFYKYAKVASFAALADFVDYGWEGDWCHPVMCEIEEEEPVYDLLTEDYEEVVEFYATGNGEGMCGCDSVTVTVTNNAPSVSIATTPGDSTTLEAITMDANVLGGNAPFTYTWADGNFAGCTGNAEFVVTPATPGSYTCKVTVEDFDGDTATAEKTVVVNPAVITDLLPTVVLFGNSPATNNSGTVNVTAGSSFTITASLNNLGNPNYNFTFGGVCAGSVVNTGSSIFVSNAMNLTAGNYVCTVTVSDSDADVAVASVPVIVGSVLGVGNSGPQTPEPSEEEDDEQDILGSGVQTCDERFTLSGSVFDDINKNNTQESGEQGIAGVLVQVYYIENGDEVIVAEETTAADGSYEFEICPGNYNIRIDRNDIPDNFSVLGASDKEVSITDDAVENFNFVLGVQDNGGNGFNWWILLLIIIVIGGGTGVYLYAGRRDE